MSYHFDNTGIANMPNGKTPDEKGYCLTRSISLFNDEAWANTATAICEILNRERMANWEAMSQHIDAGAELASFNRSLEDAMKHAEGVHKAETDRLNALLAAEGWNTNMDEAPKDVPILGWCKHETSGPDDETGRLSLYEAHAEGLSVAIDGPNVLEWGGEVDYSNWECPAEDCHIPAWWFVTGWEFERAANPVAWKHITPFVEPPKN